MTVLARDVEALRQVASEIEHEGGRALVAPADVADAAAVGQAVALAEKRFGGLDVVIANAAISLAGSSDSYSLENWQRVLDTNLTGAFVCAQSAFAALKRRGGGHIIAIDSGAGRQGYPRMAAYCASKFGLIGLMQSLAAEWGPDQIKVSTILPGSILTDFGGRSASDRARSGAKFIQPSDVADAILFLLSQPAHAWTQEMNLWPF